MHTRVSRGQFASEVAAARANYHLSARAARGKISAWRHLCCGAPHPKEGRPKGARGCEFECASGARSIVTTHFHFSEHRIVATARAQTPTGDGAEHVLAIEVTCCRFDSWPCLSCSLLFHILRAVAFVGCVVLVRSALWYDCVSNMSPSVSCAFALVLAPPGRAQQLATAAEQVSALRLPSLLTVSASIASDPLGIARHCLKLLDDCLKRR